MPPARYNFKQPKTIEEAEARIAILIDETQDIESQLSNPDKRDSTTGERMSDQEYKTWKFQASRALAIKRAEQRFLKRWKTAVFHVERVAILEALEGDPSLNLLNGLYVIVKKWVRDGVNLSHLEPSEQEYLDMVKHFLDTPPSSR
jgi:hypothetical protein